MPLSLLLTQQSRSYAAQKQFLINLPEGLVHRPVPADEGHWSEEDEPEDGESKVYTVRSVCCEVSQTGQYVQEQGRTVDWKDTGNQLTGGHYSQTETASRK